MSLVCFVLDLISLSPPLIRDLKQSLLKLANLYAISSRWSCHRCDDLKDLIGLCYVVKSLNTLPNELRVAYKPVGNFNIRDFHHAVNSLPDDIPPSIDDPNAAIDVYGKLSSVLSDEIFYAWRWDDKNLSRRLIVLSSSLPERADSETLNILMDAADQFVSVDFVVFESSFSYLLNIQKKMESFQKSLCGFDNCTVQRFLPDVSVLNGLVKQWLQSLTNILNDPTCVRFIFNQTISGSSNSIDCCLGLSVCPIVDGFNTCKTCKCHGFPLDEGLKNREIALCCPVTCHDLDSSAVMEQAIKIGDKTVLFQPSFQEAFQLRNASSPIAFHVLERTNLNSISEGVLTGCPYFVFPLTTRELINTAEENELIELNSQIFQGMNRTLDSLDQGLVCASYCNLETMKETLLRVFYLLLPSGNGPMLLRKLGGSEEVFPAPFANHFASSLPKDILNSIQASILKIEMKDYDPTAHERGFHQKVNLLVKESLQFGSFPLETEETLKKEKEKDTTDEIAASIAEEWEQLVVNKVPRPDSPTIILDTVSPSNSNKRPDDQTTKILERLEFPKKLKRKALSPIPEQKLMKPNFQKLKRKFK